MVRPNPSWLARFIGTFWKEGSDILHMHACRWGWSPRRDFSGDRPHWKVEGPWCLSGGACRWPWHHPIQQPPLFQWLPKGDTLTVAETELQCMYHWYILHSSLPHKFAYSYNVYYSLVTIKLVTLSPYGRNWDQTGFEPESFEFVKNNFYYHLSYRI